MRAAWQIRQLLLAMVTAYTLSTRSIPSKAGMARGLGARSCRGIGKHRSIRRCTGRRGHSVAPGLQSLPAVYLSRSSTGANAYNNMNTRSVWWRERRPGGRQSVEAKVGLMAPGPIYEHSE